MQFGINLIPKQEVDLQSKALFDKTKNQILLITVIYILFVVAIFFVNFIIVGRANSIKNEISKTEGLIKGQEKKELLVWTISQRADFIDKTLKERNDVASIFNSIDQITQPGVSYTDFNLSSKKITLLFSAENSKAFGDFTEQFKKNLPQFSWIGVSSVTKNKESGYDYLTEILMK